MSFFDELICRVNYVLLSSEPLVNLQQLVHLLLETSDNEDKEADEQKTNTNKTLIHSWVCQ